MVITKEIEDSIIKLSKPSIIIDDKKYYVKKADIDYDGIELVVEKLAKLVNIKCAHYERVVINNLGYYLSEDLGIGFEKATYPVRYSNRLNDMFDALQEYYPDQIVFLIDEIVKIFIFDQLIINCDRHNNNWGFIFDQYNNILDVVILDNEYSFVFSNAAEMYFNERQSNNINELISFLETSSDYMNIFSDIYNKLSPELIEKVFNEVEKENNLNIKYKNLFIKNYNINYMLINDKIKAKRL